MEPTHTPEEWRPIVGWEGQYEVSDQGRVRSLDRVVQAGHGVWREPGAVVVAPRRLKGRILKPGSASSGHIHVNLGVRTSRTVHTLVAEAFIGPCPAGMETRHINGQPADCRATNLEYGTRSENAEDSKRHGTHFHAGLTECKRGHDLTDPANLQKSPGTNKRTCLACRRERQAVYNTGSQLTKKGYCVNGHPMTPENRYTNGEGRTRCKPCIAEKRKSA